MTTRNKFERIHFSVEPRSGRLLKHGVPKSGSLYEHGCELATFTAVCHRFDEDEVGHSTTTLAEALDVPMYQTAVALAFLDERGLLTRERRALYRQTDDTYLHGMMEYHALLDQSKSR